MKKITIRIIKLNNKNTLKASPRGQLKLIKILNLIVI